MNLFILDTDPVLAAQYQCDKHIVKMPIESGQVLSVAHRILDNIRPGDPMDNVLYKMTHANNPVSLWTMESKSNYDWHYKHFIGLCDEYTYRYGKIHLTDRKFRDTLRACPKNIPDIGPTPFRLCMKTNPECMLDDPVESYRMFYKTKKDRFKMVWTRRPMPDWFLD